MENQQTTLDKVMKISIIVGALIITSSLAYYLIVFLPQKETWRMEQQDRDQLLKEQTEKARKESLMACLDDEQQKKSQTMQGLAKLKRGGKVFDLESSLDDAEKDYQIRKADCFKKYPQ